MFVQEEIGTTSQATFKEITSKFETLLAPNHLQNPRAQETCPRTAQHIGCR
jgi:hypothetical protein